MSHNKNPEIIHKNYYNKLDVKFEEIIYDKEPFYDFSGIFKKIYNKENLTESNLNKLFYLFLFLKVTIIFIYEVYTLIYLE